MIFVVNVMAKKGSRREGRGAEKAVLQGQPPPANPVIPASLHQRQCRLMKRTMSSLLVLSILKAVLQRQLKKFL